jgi:hypothetical protein
VVAIPVAKNESQLVFLKKPRYRKIARITACIGVCREFFISRLICSAPIGRS